MYTFPLEHLVLVECIDIKWLYKKQVYDYILFLHNKVTS